MTVKDVDWKEKEIDKWSKNELQPVNSIVMGAVAYYLEKGILPDSKQIWEKITEERIKYEQNNKNMSSVREKNRRATV